MRVRGKFSLSIDDQVALEVPNLLVNNATLFLAAIISGFSSPPGNLSNYIYAMRLGQGGNTPPNPTQTELVNPLAPYFYISSRSWTSNRAVLIATISGLNNGTSFNEAGLYAKFSDGSSDTSGLIARTVFPMKVYDASKNYTLTWQIEISL
ncbi:MAG: hypothetical protein QXM12_00595 [Nitrososphaerota archaeon]